MSNMSIVLYGENTRWKKGQSGNPSGRPKGAKNLSSIIKELENEDFDWSKVPIRDKEKAEAIGAPWRAIVFTALAKAYAGDLKAAEWLQRAGYGDKLDVTSKGREIQQPIIISNIKPRYVKPEAETADGS